MDKLKFIRTVGFLVKVVSLVKIKTITELINEYEDCYNKIYISNKSDFIFGFAVPVLIITDYNSSPKEECVFCNVPNYKDIKHPFCVSSFIIYPEQIWLNLDEFRTFIGNLSQGLKMHRLEFSLSEINIQAISLNVDYLKKIKLSILDHVTLILYPVNQKNIMNLNEEGKVVFYIFYNGIHTQTRGENYSYVHIEEDSKNIPWRLHVSNSKNHLNTMSKYWELYPGDNFSDWQPLNKYMDEELYSPFEAPKHFVYFEHDPKRNIINVLCVYPIHIFRKKYEKCS